MADSWTRLSPEGNIISVTESVTEHVYGLRLDPLLSQLKTRGKKSCQLWLCSQIICGHCCFARLSVTAGCRSKTEQQTVDETLIAEERI